MPRRGGISPDRMQSMSLRALGLKAIARWLFVPLLAAMCSSSNAEYGDVILNERSEAEGQRPVVFPHWFHRIRFQCRVCHDELGFEMRAGANHASMREISNGAFCGVCHNGEIAWSVEQCGLCHSGRAGAVTGVRGGHQTLGPGIW